MLETFNREIDTDMANVAHRTIMGWTAVQGLYQRELLGWILSPDC
jgi:hypothetical protein